MNRMKYFFLFSLFPAFLQAQTYLKDYFPIDVWGNIDLAVKWFNFIAIFCNINPGAGFGSNIDLFSIAIILSAIFSLITLIQKGGQNGIREVAINAIVSLGIVVFTVSSPVTVLIQDARVLNGSAITGAVSKKEVANVPYPIAFVASAFSNFSTFLVKRVEVQLADPDAPLYTEVGLLRHLHFSIPRTNPLDKTEKGREFKETLTQYIQNCVYQFGDENDISEVNSQINITKIDPANMSSPVIRHNNGMLAMYNGETCQSIYNRVKTLWNSVKGQTERDLIKSYDMTPQNFAMLSAKADYNKQLVEDQVRGADGFYNFITQPLLQDIADRAKLAKTLGIGSGITGNSALIASESYLQRKSADGSALADWLTNAKLLEKSSMIIQIIAYGLFPLIVVFSLPRMLMGKIRMLCAYFGGTFGVSLLPFGLMIGHTLATRDIFTEAQKITSDNGVMYLNQEYYSLVLEEAYVSTILAGLISVALPTVLMTGGVMLLLGMAGRAMTSGVGNVETAMADTAQAKMDQLTGKSAGDLALAGMMNDITASSATKLGNWEQMEGENGHGGALQWAQTGQQTAMANATAGEIQAKEDSYIASGSYQGIQQASTALKIGETYQSGYESSAGGKPEWHGGDTLARSSGQYAGMQQVSAGKALMAGDFVDSSGNISGKQGALLDQGMINQVRWGQNATAGYGLGGEFNREQMQRVQDEAQYGIQASLSQTRAKNNTYGQNYEAYGKDMGILADKQIKDTHKLAEEYGSTYNLMGGTGKKSYDEIAEEKADQAVKTEAGSVKAYIKNKAKYGENYATDLAYAKGISEGNAFKKILDDQKRLDFNSDPNLQKKAREEFSKTEEGQKVERARTHLKEARNKQQEDYDKLGSGKTEVSYNITRAGKKVDVEYKEDKNITATHEANRERVKEATSQLIQAGKEQSEDYKKFESNFISRMSNSKALEHIADIRGTAEAINFGQLRADQAGKIDSGFATAQGLTSAGASAVQIASSQQAHNMLGNRDIYANTRNFQEMMSQTGLNSMQQSHVMSTPSIAERANRFQAMTRSGSIKGTVGGRSFNLTAGTDGDGWHGGFDSSVSFRGGYTASYGDAISGIGGSLGGITGLQIAGGINTGISALSTVAGLATRAGQIGKVAQRGWTALNSIGLDAGGVASAPAQSAIYSQEMGTIAMDMNGGSLSNIAIPMAKKGQKRHVYLKMQGGGPNGGGGMSGSGGSGL